MTAKRIPNEDALGIIEDSINAGKRVKLRVRGNSMSPLLLDGVDSVILHPCNPTELKSGDIIFFRYKGRFLLHRIIRFDKPADQPAGYPAGHPTDFSSVQPTDRPEDYPAGHPANQFDNRAGSGSGGQSGGDPGNQSAGNCTGFPADSGLITTRGDALAKTETITLADVIAIAEVPRHTFIRKAFRRLVIFGRRVRGFLVRRFLVK